MDEIGTDTLRKIAPRWTLAGDEKLLTVLQNTHQRLVSRCQQTSCQLDQMTGALEDVTIRLQNVNNQFMSLSSSQFIESRVYDDDADVTTDNTSGKEIPVPSLPDELAMLKRSVEVITSTHEVITIVDDSDSDSDDGVTDRQVLKPKDVYEERPLPYIIGSEPWKNKWHAGLVLEDSDTDSCTSKVERDSDQYSQSEPEDFAPHSTVGLLDNVQDSHPTNLSESSSDIPPEAPTKPTPSDVASELARRLGAGVPSKIPVRGAEYEEPSPQTTTKVYRPQATVPITIFTDEPPPLDEQKDSDTDIFAELQRNQPYRHTHRTDVSHELFGGGDEGDIFSDFANEPPVTKATSLFEAGPKPHMFDKQHLTTEPKEQTEEQTSKTTEQNDIVDSVHHKLKKPVGGISLFGSNKGTENIGAAILKRHQRQSSSSDGGSGSETPEPNKQQNRKEKDIFDDLFAKNKNKNKTSKNIVQEIQKKNQEKITKEIPKSVDLFSDNLFDDIDDIFTTDVVKTTKNSKNTIFEDEDALFSEITEQKVVKSDKNIADNKEKKGLFDSDDDLFLEKSKIISKPEPTDIVNENTKSNLVNTEVQSNKVANTNNLYDDDGDIFNDTKIRHVNTTKENNNLIKPLDSSNKVFNSSSLFEDDDDDSDDLFKDTIKSPNLIVNKSNVDDTYKNRIKKEVKFVEEKSKIDNKSNEVVCVPNSNYIEKNSHPPPETVKTVINRETTHIIDNTLFKQNSTTSKNGDGDFDFEKPLKDNICDTNNISNEDIITIYSDVDNNTHLNNSEMSGDKLNDENSNHVSNVKNRVDVFNQTSSQNINKTVTAENNKWPTIIYDDVASSFEAKKDVTENVISEVKLNDGNSNKTLNSDVFSHILSEPPVFEKPKEPKKSKNVNALFDDDSDDETLFFKKDDVVSSDDNQDEFTPAQNTLFDIFTDLPPDEHINEINDDLDDGIFNNTLATENAPESKNKKTITSKVNLEHKGEQTDDEMSENSPSIEKEDDWTVDEKASITKLTKPEVVRNITVTLQSTDKTATRQSQTLKETNSNNDIFKHITSSNMLKNDVYLAEDNDEGLFKSLPVDLCKSASQISDAADLKNYHKSDDEQFQSLPNIDTIKLDEESSVDITDQEKVSTESVLTEKIDKKVGKLKIGLNINVKALLPGASPTKIKNVDSLDGQTQSNVKVENEDTKPLGVEGFAGKLESEILDNKLSKERPRIQVKRRPSTRKARKEAVRKSGINFLEDSTDNSSSIDDPPTVQNETQDIVENSDLINQGSDINKLPDEELIIKDTGKLTENNMKYDNKPINKDEAQTESVNCKLTEQVNSTSTRKIVYIINDEDIFNTNNIVTGDDSNNSTDNIQSKLLTNTSDKTINVSTYQYRTDESSVKTLGRTYHNKSDEKTSLFGEDDDEIFRNKKPIVKASLFDSDSDGELFGATKKTEVKKKIEKVQVKGSLFGDDDDNDDHLFGVNTNKTNDAQPKSVPSIKETTACTLPVFEDPLSMFNDDQNYNY